MRLADSNRLHGGGTRLSAPDSPCELEIRQILLATEFRPAGVGRSALASVLERSLADGS